MKIVTVLGARPQFIKAAILSRSLQAKNLTEVIVHTGQHYDLNMSEVFFEEMQIPTPSYNLEISSRSHAEMTGRMLIEIERTIIKESPDVVLVYGDTNSTLAGALAASKLHVPIAHVEAGLRSFNRQMPEEINRVLTDHASNYLFAPTGIAVSNLVREGIAEHTIFQTGDIMYDAVLFYAKLAEKKSRILDSMKLSGEQFLLATIHRQENTNHPERLNSIFDQLESLSKEKVIVLPLHPRTRSYLKKDYENSNFRIVDPVGYFDMLLLQKNCRMILTDSGGLQKEAYFHRKFCITLREETEWIELVSYQYNFLARPLNSLVDLVERLWDKPFPSSDTNLYGEGKASEKIATILAG